MLLNHGTRRTNRTDATRTDGVGLRRVVERTDVTRRSKEKEAPKCAGWTDSHGVGVGYIVFGRKHILHNLCNSDSCYRDVGTYPIFTIRRRTVISTLHVVVHEVIIILDIQHRLLDVHSLHFPVHSNRSQCDC